MDTGATLVVAKALIQGTQVEFFVDQVIERELEGSGLDLFAQHHRQQPRARAGDCLHHGRAAHDVPAIRAASFATTFRRFVTTPTGSG
jgi:hypothetical protein